MSEYGNGAVVFSNWTIKHKIGEGSFGQVYEIWREDFGETYRAALKVITVPQSESEFRAALEEGMSSAQAEQYFYGVVEDIVREFAIMARLKGTANVVGYEDHTVIRHKDGVGWDILIRMELLNPLLTYAYRHPFSRRDIIRLGIDMCHALELCQKYNIIHRDIKPENIFVSDNGDFKLGDFGIARTIDKTMSGLSKKGTYNYMAPEVYRGSEYGFSVDIYSLGIVLYRLLNRNRIPFLPPAPDPITFQSKESALAKRMGGEAFPRPFHAEGRLAEIILKACAFNPKERYSNPAQMCQELEAILYDKEDSELIYPDGDELVLAENLYASIDADSDDAYEASDITDKTESVFLNTGKQSEDMLEVSKTEGIFRKSAISSDGTDKTESVFKKRNKAGTVQDKQPASAKKSNAKVRIIISVTFTLLTIGGIAFYMQHQNKLKRQEAERLANYQQLITEGTELCSSDPEQAAELFLQAQELSPEETVPFTSYAYALYCMQDYDKCITYIEDELSLGKKYDAQTQGRLSEILGAAYFEKDDYAAAASFFRLSTAGGDITVAAMRDYAVSLGRLGDVEAADEILQRMYNAGAKSDVTDYVQAEVDYALKDYLSAEKGFRAVLDTTKDTALQKRALRSAAEVYRDCAALARTDESPISYPATKSAELRAWGIETYSLRYDSTIWEMLALAYFESYHTDPSAPPSYLTKAADCFNRVIELGITKDYLYSNLYTIYYELQEYEKADHALKDYEIAFPNDYMPHAFRGMMLITIENEKSRSSRDYLAAYDEYEIAGQMIRGSDDATYYQQLESLIQQLKNEGWL